MTSTAALRANPTDQCGTGCVNGTPGVRTSAAILDQSMARKSAVEMPSAAASASLRASSSPATTSAPPATSARQVASPEPPSPNTATRLPAKVVTGIMAPPPKSPQFQRRQSRQRQHDGDDPEPDHDLRLGPAELLEMMVDGRHQEDALAGHLEPRDLHDHRHRLQHEQAADHRQH